MKKYSMIVLPVLLTVLSLAVVFHKQILVGVSGDSIVKSDSDKNMLGINSGIGNMKYEPKNTSSKSGSQQAQTVSVTPVTTEPPIVNFGPLTVDQKKRIFELTSLFENDSIKLQYDYIENLDDGRGYTAGIAGFTTADGDMYDLVKMYTQKKADNPLAKYLNTLKKLAEDGSDSTSKLSGFKEAWTKAASDPVFQAAQDEEVNITYFEPAMKYCSDQGLKSPLAKAILYDTIIQHGDGDDPDSISAIIKKTDQVAGGSPKTGVNEMTWLQDFLKVRKDILKHASDSSTRDVWADSTGRCDVLSGIVSSGNSSLNGPIKVKTDEYDAIIP